MSTTGDRGTWRNPLLGAAVVCASVAVSVFALKVLPLPFFWIGLAVATACLMAAVSLSRPWPTVPFFLLFNIGIAAGGGALVEAYAWSRQPQPVEYSDGYNVRDDVLGSAPTKGIRAHSSQREGRSFLYDVTYTIGDNGLRLSPPVGGDGVNRCVLFFGGSYMFGEGLQDEETLPYQVGLQSGGTVATFNFGFHGYGPHQMLSAVEQGLVSKVVDCHPDYAVYLAIPHHVARAAGKVSFGRHAPRYLLEKGGRLVRHGHFDDDQTPAPSPWVAHVIYELRKSAAFRLLQSREPATTPDDVQLTLAIVQASRRRLEALYPGIEFHVILWRNWTYDQTVYRALCRGIAELNVPLHLVDDILPDFTPGDPRYILSSANRHPSALANRLLAHYVLTQIVSREPRVVTTKGRDHAH